MAYRNDEIFEALLKIAAREALERKVAAMPSIDELDRLYQPSPAIVKRIHKIIDRHENFDKLRRISRTLGRVAAIFCVFATLSTSILMSVEASRVFILNTIIRWQSDHVVLEFTANDRVGLADGYILAYLPEGFELVSRQVINDMTVEIFVNQEGSQLIFNHHRAGTAAIATDTEFTDFSTITIGGQGVYMFAATIDYGLSALMWRIGDTVFSLTSDIGIDELIMIAENILSN